MTDKLRVAVRKFAPFEAAISAQFASFREAGNLDIALEAVVMDLDELHERLFCKGELRDGSFDVAFIPTDWIGEAQASESVADLAQLLKHDPPPDYPEDWPVSLREIQSFSEGVWGLPYHDGPQCLIYRTDLLSAAGIEPPSTWLDFENAARRLHGMDGVAGTVFGLFPDGHNIFYDYCIHVWSRGGEIWDDIGLPVLSSPESVAALDFLGRLANDPDVVAPDLQALDSIRTGALFSQGRVAIMTNWFGFAAHSQMAQDSQVRGKIGVAPIPGNPKSNSTSLNVYWLLSLSAGSRQPGLGWAFMKHCAHPDQDHLLTKLGGIGTRKTTWRAADIREAMPFATHMDELHRTARTLPAVRQIPDLATLVGELVTVAVANGGCPSREVLSDFETRAKALWS